MRDKVRDPLFAAHENTKQWADARRKWPAWSSGMLRADWAAIESRTIAELKKASAPATCGGLPVIRNVSTATIRDLRWVDDPIRDRAIPTLQLAGGACFPLGNVLAAIDAEYPEAIDTLAAAREGGIVSRLEAKMVDAIERADLANEADRAANAEIARLNRALAASRAAYHERPGNPGELAALRGAIAKASAEAGEARKHADDLALRCVDVEAKLIETMRERNEAVAARDAAEQRERAALGQVSQLAATFAAWSEAQRSGDPLILDIADRKRLAAILAWTRDGEPGKRTIRGRSLSAWTDESDRYEVRDAMMPGSTGYTIGTLAEICDRLGL